MEKVGGGTDAGENAGESQQDCQWCFRMRFLKTGIY
jgi:hypothetical protein